MDKSKILIFSFFIIFSIQSYSSQNFITYKVSKGDTFYSLSRRFNVDIWQIQQANNILDLKVGQVIKIPNRTFVEYKVKKGDTLFSLAKRFGSTIEEILSVNHISEFNIKDGQVIKIPVKGSGNNISESSNVKKKYNKKVYIVKKGDTLYSISRKVGISATELAKINGFNKNIKLREGMIILVKNDKIFSTHKKSDLGNNIPIPEFSLPFRSIISVNNRYDKFIDIQLGRLEPVLSLNDGIVIFIGTFGIFGKTVIVKYEDNIYCVYGLLNDIYVNNGQKITRGQKIGTPIFDDNTKVFKFKLSLIVGDRMIVPNKRFVKL